MIGYKGARTSQCHCSLCLLHLHERAADRLTLPMPSPISSCCCQRKQPQVHCNCQSESCCAASLRQDSCSPQTDCILAAQISRKKKRSTGQASVGSMRIITGSAAGKRLVSPPGEGTRPMMEKVRGAVFNMVASMAGSQPLLPPGTRWLDLFAGTGELLSCTPEIYAHHGSVYNLIVTVYYVVFTGGPSCPLLRSALGTALCH